MKKILIATTALVATAGVAAADITVGGNGRMGVTYDSTAANKTAFTSRIRVTFAASGETDGGIGFGGSIRADNAGAGALGTAGSVFMSYSGLTLSMGDVDGAAEKAVGDLHGVGLTGIGDWNENTYLSNAAAANRSAARVDYAMNGFTLSASTNNPGGDVLASRNTFALGAAYAMGDYSVGLGYESQKQGALTVGHVIAGASATFNGVTLKATYGSASKLNLKQYGVSASGSFDAIGVTAFVRVADNTVTAVSGAKVTSMGLGGSYSLGGGASVVGGIAKQTTKTFANVKTSQTRADLGVSFSF